MGEIAELTVEPAVETKQAEETSTPKAERKSSGVLYKILDEVYTLSELTPVMEGDKRGWKLPDGKFVSEETLRKSRVNRNRAGDLDE